MLQVRGIVLERENSWSRDVFRGALECRGVWQLCLSSALLCHSASLASCAGCISKGDGMGSSPERCLRVWAARDMSSRRPSPSGGWLLCPLPRSPFQASVWHALGLSCHTLEGLCGQMGGYIFGNKFVYTKRPEAQLCFLHPDLV